MATPPSKSPGPRQRFPSNIIRIQFPNKGYICYFYYQYSYGGYGILPNPNATIAPPPDGFDLLFNFDGRELNGVPNFKIFGSAPVKIVPASLPFDEFKKDVPIVNPITIGMLKHYAIFTPGAPYKDETSKPQSPEEVWVIDRAAWNMVYNNHVTDRSTPADTTYDDAQAQFLQIAAEEGLDASRIGVTLQEVLYPDGQFRLPPTPPDPAGWAFWGSGQGYSGHMENHPRPNVFGQYAAGNVIFNLNLVKMLLPEGSRENAKEVNFKLQIGQLSKQSLQLRCYARLFEIKPNEPLTFPLDSKGRPPWVVQDIYNVLIVFSTPANLDFADVKIKFPQKRPDGSFTDPEIDMELLARAEEPR